MQNFNNSKIGVLIKTSFVDYPGCIAAALFVRGCNMRCPYCYNKDLVLGNVSDEEMVSFDQILEHLQKRKKVLTGFVISGGEPTISPYTEKLILEAKKLGYKIKLDTNGLCPEKLEYYINSPALCPDFIAMDIKTSLNKYSLLKPQGNLDAESNILKSIELISKLPAEQREFRTVLIPPLVSEQEIIEIAEILPKDASWMFAKFRPGECIDSEYNKIKPYNDLQYSELEKLASTYIPKAQLR